MHVGLRHFDSQTLDWLAGALRSGEATRPESGVLQVRGTEEGEGAKPLAAKVVVNPAHSRHLYRQVWLRNGRGSGLDKEWFIRSPKISNAAVRTANAGIRCNCKLSMPRKIGV